MNTKLNKNQYNILNVTFQGKTSKQIFYWEKHWETLGLQLPGSHRKNNLIPGFPGKLAIFLAVIS